MIKIETACDGETRAVGSQGGPRILKLTALSSEEQ